MSTTNEGACSNGRASCARRSSPVGRRVAPERRRVAMAVDGGGDGGEGRATRERAGDIYGTTGRANEQSANTPPTRRRALLDRARGGNRAARRHVGGRKTSCSLLVAHRTPANPRQHDRRHCDRPGLTATTRRLDAERGANSSPLDVRRLATCRRPLSVPRPMTCCCFITSPRLQLSRRPTATRNAANFASFGTWRVERTACRRPSCAVNSRPASSLLAVGPRAAATNVKGKKRVTRPSERAIQSRARPSADQLVAPTSRSRARRQPSVVRGS